MDMSMSMSMATATSTAMSMATSASSSMDMTTSSDMMGMSSMAMTFFTSASTPLYSMSWMPASTGQYAGTCIFLIFMSAIFRGLLAVRVNLFQVVRSARGQGKDETCYGMGNKANIRPWRASEAAWIASMDCLLGGVAYLL
ncbi:MAG: hypothetical protein CL912_27000 [Deltaproteobacteria bacterium]|nr:hypothetical protein [Deltaproteobacteria bacterium]